MPFEPQSGASGYEPIWRQSQWEGVQVEGPPITGG